MNNSTLDYIKQIIDNELEMPENRVWAYNGTQDLPEDANMFIILSYLTKSPYSNNCKYVEKDGRMQAISTTNFAENILISCISQSTEARDRVHEVLMALKSTYSTYIQEENHIHISTINEIVDSSFLEASSRMNRFDIRITVMRAYEKIKDVDFYDKFPNTQTFEPNWFIEEK